MQKLRPLSPFIVWPPFVAKQPASLRDVVTNLNKSQWWSLSEYESGWQVQLGLLLKWAATNVTYYRNSSWAKKRLKAIRRTPDNFWEEWRKIPLLTKTDLRTHGQILRQIKLPEHHPPTGEIVTSGSTGIPVKVLSTNFTRLDHFALSMREHIMFRRNFLNRFGAIRFLSSEYRGPDGVDKLNWGNPVARLYNSGLSSGIHVSLPLENHIRWLYRFNPHYLLTYPSIAEALLNEIGPASAKPSALEEIRFISEPLDAALEERFTQEWGVRCTDMYSANEVGYIAVRCPEQGNLHVQCESIIVELLNDDGEICKPGETGRVVVTPLHNMATPLIRYEIGDYAVAGEPCPCGRESPVISKVLGRVRNYARTPDGRRFWPGAIGNIGRVKPILQTQLVQTSIDTIEVRMVINKALTEDQEIQAVKVVQEQFDYPFQVKLIAVDRIERGPTGKYEDFLSLIN